MLVAMVMLRLQLNAAHMPMHANVVNLLHVRANAPMCLWILPAVFQLIWLICIVVLKVPLYIHDNFRQYTIRTVGHPNFEA